MTGESAPRSLNDPDVLADLRARADGGEAGAEVLLRALSDPGTVYVDTRASEAPEDHCRHCASDCPRWINRDGVPIHENTAARWVEDHCPACAEAERLAEVLDDLAAEASNLSVAAAYRYASELARYGS